MTLPHDAVILAGGRATRLGGTAKPLVEVGGRTLLDAALAGASTAENTVVVGAVPVPEGVLQVVEEPRFSGPAAALATGFSVLQGIDRGSGRPPPWVLVLAADLPRVDQAVPTLLAAAAAETTDANSDGICFRDGVGHPQWMLAAYRRSSLEAAIAAVTTTDLSLRRLLAPLTLTSIPGNPDDIADCDTWDDVETARARSCRD